MMRKSLIAGLGFLGLVAAGTLGGSTQASAAYGCGYWNNWCRPVCGYWNGWCAGIYATPGFSWGYSRGYWNRPYYGRNYGHRNWGSSRSRGHHAHRGGGNRHHAHKRSNNRRHHR